VLLRVIFTGEADSSHAGPLLLRGTSKRRVLANGNETATSTPTATSSPTATPPPSLSSGSLLYTAYTTGFNNYGQLGDGTETDRATPGQVMSGYTVNGISAGDLHTMFLTVDGQVFGTGRNNGGQLGDGTLNGKTTPVQVMSGHNVTQVIAGYSHTVFLTAEGKTYATGQNDYGQLGDNTTADKSSPVHVMSNLTVVLAALGELHTVFLTSDGQAFTTGGNGYGQLGDNSTTHRQAPVHVMRLYTVTGATAGLHHTVFLTAEGEVYSTGGNEYGQLGDGTDTAKSSPVRVMGEFTLRDVAAGAVHTVFLTSEGEAHATGHNYFGQLGDGSSEDKSAPVQVMSGYHVVGMAAGKYHTIFLTSNELYATGYNAYGQLGDNTTTNTYTPVLVHAAATDNDSEDMWIYITAGGYHTGYLISAPKTASPTLTHTPTITTAPTETPAPTITSVPTETPAPTTTPVPTVTATPTVTLTPTVTSVPTVTSAPSSAYGDGTVAVSTVLELAEALDNSTATTILILADIRLEYTLPCIRHRELLIRGSCDDAQRGTCELRGVDGTTVLCINESSIVAIENLRILFGAEDSDSPSDSQASSNRRLLSLGTQYQRAIEVDGSDLSVQDFTLSDAVGGGVSIRGNGTLRVDNSTFRENKAMEAATNGLGGAIDLQGEANLIISSSFFTANRANEGGAMYVRYATGVEIYNSTFRNNVAEIGTLGAGTGRGGVLVLQSHGSVVIHDSNFAENLADTSAGAIYLSGAQLFVLQCAFTDNACSKTGGGISADWSDESGSGALEVRSCSFRSNRAHQMGGALFAGGATGNSDTRISVRLGNVTFDGNSADMGNGGAVAIAQSDLEVEDCVYASNAAGSGGALYGVANSTVTMFAHTLFENNFAYASGGAMFCSGGSDVNITDAIQVSFNRGEQGAGLFIGDCAVHILNGSWLYGNAAVKEGGGVFMHTAHSLEERGVLLASGLIVEANGALQYSGAGIAASSNSLLALHGASLLSNRAHHGSGGAVYAVNSTIEIASSSMLAHNVAAGGGGGGIFLLGELAQLHLDHSQVELNNASEGGGGLMITGGAAASITNSSQLAGNADGAVYVSKRASLEISDSTVTGNLGAPHKGFAGIGLSEGAAGLLEGVLLDDQGGTAVWIGDGSSATLLGVVLARNTVADELGEGSGEQGVGAGVLCHEGGSAVLRDCHLEANLAANGPAIHASGNLTVSSSSFVQNAAFEDGAVYVRMRDEVTLKNVSFRNNTASNGAALYLAEGDLSGGDAARQGGSNATMERLSLSEIDMHGNHASEGGILFWAPLNLVNGSDAWRPTCANCTTRNNSVGYAASDGWATKAAGLRAASVHEEAAGGYPLQQPVVVELVDLYGTVVSTAEPVEVRVNSSCGVQGTLCVPTRCGVAEFRDLVLSGPGGSRCVLRHTADTSGAEGLETSTVVPLRYCLAGERYTSTRECVRCAAGSLSFDNDTESCHDCGSQSGIRCPGAADYEVLPGYWLPPIANACETASCLVSLVEACQVEDACDTTSSQRSASGAHAANDLALCATSSGYTTGVLCGGTLPTSCSSGSYSSTEGDACLSCPSKGAVIGQLLVTVVIGVAINFLSGYGLMVTSEQALKAADPDEFRETAEEIADPEDEMQYPGQLWTIIGLVIGYFQVIGEFPNLFSSDVVPDAFNAYTRHLFVFKPNLSAMLNAPCLEYHLLSSGSNTSPFWLLFFQAVLTPWIVMLAAWLLYSTTAFFFQRRHGLQGAEAERARTVIGRKVAAMVLFAFTALHPSVSTTVMSLFDCRDIWYEDAESKQSWVRQDTSIECGNWDVGPVLALLTILYLPAFPLGIAGYMWWARGYVKCRITRGGADDDLSRILEHGWVINGWKESMEVGQGSWRWLPQSRPLSQFSQFLNPLRNVPASSSAPPGDDDTDDDSEHGVIVMTGLEESENSEEEEEQRALDDEPPYVDVYLHASLILLDHVSVGASWRTGDICWERASTEDDEPGVRRKGVVIKWPQTKLPAEVYIKEVKGDGGAADYVPVTWLDSAKVLQTLGAVFIEPFASHLYLWNTYEIGRRFLQTAGVLVVAVALDSTSAMAYATLISVAALSIHLRVAPFKADADDFLMTAILANQFICQFSIMCIKISDANIRGFGLFLLLAQAAVLLVALKPTAPSLRSAFKKYIANSTLLLQSKIFSRNSAGQGSWASDGEPSPDRNRTHDLQAQGETAAPEQGADSSLIKHARFRSQSVPEAMYIVASEESIGHTSQQHIDDSMTPRHQDKFIFVSDSTAREGTDVSYGDASSEVMSQESLFNDSMHRASKSWI
ncbi:hypothetical protein CYMTET_51498, partial [Cymbomonas tetramitiformis]